ncbi:MAG: c-type cytochrome biogenesis protein CcmI [Betaproteobacteria bacterium]|nr:c-type cytochrome biogenesis protein CcmI [Betaproteobacteria bacterium]
MTIFGIIAGALAVIAVLIVVLPLLKYHEHADAVGSRTGLNISIYRDQLAELDEDRRSGRLGDDQYEQARGELERRVVEDVPDAHAPARAPAQRGSRAAAAVAGVAVPLSAVLLYVVLGNTASLLPQQVADRNIGGKHQLDAMIAQLAARLEKNPQDGKGWVMLARSQAVLGRFGEASAAFARSVAIFPDDAQLLADYADVLAMARGGRLQGEPESLVERALRADPNNVKAHALAGTVAFESKDFGAAVDHWERLQGLVPSGSEFAESVKASIREAKGLADAGGGTRRATGSPGKAQASAIR